MATTTIKRKIPQKLLLPPPLPDERRRGRGGRSRRDVWRKELSSQTIKSKPYYFNRHDKRSVLGSWADRYRVLCGENCQIEWAILSLLCDRDSASYQAFRKIVKKPNHAEFSAWMTSFLYSNRRSQNFGKLCKDKRTNTSNFMQADEEYSAIWRMIKEHRTGSNVSDKIWSRKFVWMMIRCCRILKPWSTFHLVKTMGLLGSQRIIMPKYLLHGM